MTDGCQQPFSPRYSQTYGFGLAGVQWVGGVSVPGRAVVVTGVGLGRVLDDEAAAAAVTATAEVERE